MLKTEIMIFSKYKILLNSNLLNYGSKMRHTAKKQRTSEEALYFFIQADRLGISSRDSVYTIAVGAYHHTKCA